MVKETITRKLSFRTSALVVLTACLIVGTVEFQALKAKEPMLKPGQKVNAAECVRCHSDPKSINIMRLKEDGGNYLFNSDGTFKDPKLADLTGNYRHTGTGGGTQKAGKDNW